MSSCPDERILGCHRRDPNRRMRLLNRPGHEPNVVKLVKLSFVGNSFLCPKSGYDVDSLLEPCSALIHIHAEGIEFLWDKSPSKTCVEPAVADVVQHRKLAGELYRIVESGNDRACDQPEPSSARGDGRQEHDGIWAVTAVVVEVVFNCLYRRVT